MSGRIKGWCPTAHRPMMSGDGLLVRVRPQMARLSASEVRALCNAARRFGNGMIDITSRANLQIRGVAEGDHAAVLAELVASGLVHEDADVEAKRITTVTPFWRVGDLTTRLANMLETLSLPALSDKMGIVVDAGAMRYLADTPGDFRFETSVSGDLMLRADGAKRGRTISESAAGAALEEMVEWFLATGGADSGRMARHLQITRLPQAWHTAEPSVAADTPQPGEVREGTLYGVPFGQTDADVLERLITNTGASHLRVTPWRMLLAEGAVVTDVPGLLTQPDPLLNIAACPGAPGCAQASVATRDLARALAQHTRGSLHVSGCDKGCARRTKADTTLVGKNGRFDLVKDGRPGDTPHQSGLSEAEVLTKMARADAL